MVSDLFWILAIVGFIAQILCCIYGRNPVHRLAPMLVMGGIMALTVVGCSIKLLSVILAVAEGLILAVMALGYLLCRLVFTTKK